MNNTKIGNYKGAFTTLVSMLIGCTIPAMVASPQECLGLRYASCISANESIW